MSPYLELSLEAGWNQTEEDWERLQSLEPNGIFQVDCDGVVAATATLLTFGNTLGWVGMVLTRASHRRRGFARRLMNEVLDEAHTRNIATLKLDATDAGRPLYLDCGFIDEQPIERWRREPAPLPTAEPPRYGPIPVSLDREAFGADRTAFLAELGFFAVAPEAYASSRPGARARYLGPCVARDEAAAADLIRSTIALHPSEPWFWDLLPSNVSAVRIATGLGFSPVRRLTRMRLGPPLANNDALVYAIAGFEAG
jgi:GNAT superfamily N-acetyltransferase